MIKKNNKKNNIILLIFSVIIGIMVSMQIDVNVIASETEMSKSVEEYLVQIQRTQEDIEKLDKLVLEKEKKLNVLVNSEHKDYDLIRFLEKDIMNNKISSGFRAMRGTGIEITMYDNMDSDIIGSNVNDDIIHDIDILNILNDLRIAGAEAISINNQRVISSTEVKCGGPIIRINGKSYATPFIIRAIGDKSQLMAAVTAPGTYGDILKNVYQLQFEAETKENIKIPSYDGNFRYIYARPVEVGE